MGKRALQESRKSEPQVACAQFSNEFLGLSRASMSPCPIALSFRLRVAQNTRDTTLSAIQSSGKWNTTV